MQRQKASILAVREPGYTTPAKGRRDDGRRHSAGAGAPANLAQIAKSRIAIPFVLFVSFVVPKIEV